MKKILSAVAHLSLALVVVGGLSYVEAAWQPPTAAPVQDAVINPPLNTGSANQVKTGSIGASSIVTAYSINVGAPGTVGSPSMTNSLLLAPQSDNQNFYIELFDNTHGTGGNQRLHFTAGNANPTLMTMDFNTASPKIVTYVDNYMQYGKLAVGGPSAPGPASEKVEVAGRVKADDYCLRSDPSKCLSNALVPTAEVTVTNSVEYTTRTLPLPAARICFLTANKISGSSSTNANCWITGSGTTWQINARGGNGETISCSARCIE